MTKPRTAGQWLSLGDDLPMELATVFSPREKSKHRIYARKFKTDAETVWCCHKCKGEWQINQEGKLCSIPDPTKIDWNTAKHYQEQCDEYLFIVAAQEVRKVLFPDACQDREWLHWWLAYMCRPEDAKYVLVIAAIAMERNKE